MAVRSKLLAAGSTGAGPTSIYTAPAQTVTIVKSVIVRNAGAAAGPVVLIVRQGASDVSNLALWCAAFGTNGDSVVSLPWLCLEPGNTLRVTYPSSSGGWYTVSGAELVL